MSTKKKAGPKWPGTMDPMPIRKAGVYELRSEKRVKITKGSDNRWIDDSNETTRKHFWNSYGVHSTNKTSFDVMAFIKQSDEPKPEPPKRDVITRLGKYDTVGGERFVEVCWHEPDVNESFPWRGVVKYKNNGQIMASNFRWNDEGKCREYQKLEITGPFKEPVVETVSSTSENPIITGPGEYVTVDGRKVIIEFKTRSTKTGLPWVGFIEGYNHETWGVDGATYNTAEPGRNIVGPWVDKKKFLVPCINVSDGQWEVFCLSAKDAWEASKWVSVNHPDYCVGNAMTADEMTKYINAAIRPAIEGVEK